MPRDHKNGIAPTDISLKIKPIVSPLSAEHMDVLLEKTFYVGVRSLILYSAQQPFHSRKNENEDEDTSERKATSSSAIQYEMTSAMRQFCETFHNAFASGKTCFIPINLSQSSENPRWVGILLMHHREFFAEKQKEEEQQKKEAGQVYPDEIICLNPLGHEGNKEICGLPSPLEAISRHGIRSFVSLSLLVGLIHVAMKKHVFQCTFTFRQQSQTVLPHQDGYWLIELLSRELSPQKANQPIGFDYFYETHYETYKKHIENFERQKQLLATFNHNTATPRLVAPPQNENRLINTEFPVLEAIIHSDVKQAITYNNVSALQVWSCPLPVRQSLVAFLKSKPGESSSADNQYLLCTAFNKHFSFVEALAFTVVKANNGKALMELLCMPYADRCQLIEDMASRQFLIHLAENWQQAREEVQFQLYFYDLIKKIRDKQRSDLASISRRSGGNPQAGVIIEILSREENKQILITEFNKNYGREPPLDIFNEKDRSLWEKKFSQQCQVLLPQLTVTMDINRLANFEDALFKILYETLENQATLWTLLSTKVAQSFERERNFADVVKKMDEAEQALKLITPHLDTLKTQGFFKEITLERAQAMVLLHELDLDKQDSRGNTLLHLASSRCHKDFIRLLLTAGAHPLLLNQQNKTPLDLLALQSRTTLQWTECYQLFCNVMGISDTKSIKVTHLLYSIDTNIKTVISNFKDDDDRTLLHLIALNKPHANLIETLISLGCNPIALDRYKKTALDYLLTYSGQQTETERYFHAISPHVLEILYRRTKESGQSTDQFNELSGVQANTKNPLFPQLSTALIAQRESFKEYLTTLEQRLNTSEFTSRWGANAHELRINNALTKPHQTRYLENSIWCYYWFCLIRAQFELLFNRAETNGQEQLQKDFIVRINKLFRQIPRNIWAQNDLFGIRLFFADRGITASIREITTPKTQQQSSQTTPKKQEATQEQLIQAQHRADLADQQKEQAQHEKEQAQHRADQERHEKEQAQQWIIEHCQRHNIPLPEYLKSTTQTTHQQSNSPPTASSSQDAEEQGKRQAAQTTASSSSTSSTTHSPLSAPSRVAPHDAFHAAAPPLSASSTTQASTSASQQQKSEKPSSFTSHHQ